MRVRHPQRGCRISFSAKEEMIGIVGSQYIGNSCEKLGVE